MNYLHLVIWSIYMFYSTFTYYSLKAALNSQYEADKEGWELLVKGKIDLEKEQGVIFKSVEEYTSDIFKVQLWTLGVIAIILSVAVVFLQWLW